jgi:hypothetical protein
MALHVVPHRDSAPLQVSLVAVKLCALSLDDGPAAGHSAPCSSWHSGKAVHALPPQWLSLHNSPQRARAVPCVQVRLPLRGARQHHCTLSGDLICKSNGNNTGYCTQLTVGHHRHIGGAGAAMPISFSWRVCDRGGGRVHRSLHGGSPAAAAPAARLQPPLLPSGGDSGYGPKYWLPLET